MKIMLAFANRTLISVASRLPTGSLSPASSTLCDSVSKIWYNDWSMCRSAYIIFMWFCAYNCVPLVCVLADLQKLEREARICRLLKHPNIGTFVIFIFSFHCCNEVSLVDVIASRFHLQLRVSCHSTTASVICATLLCANLWHQN